MQTIEERRFQQRLYYANNREKRKISRYKDKDYPKKHYANYKYNYYKATAKKKNLEFFISKEEFDFLTSSVCFYCNSSSDIGVDRLDSTLGYIKNNVVPCCTMCNYMKNDYNYDEFINQCQKINKNQLYKQSLLSI